VKSNISMRAYLHMPQASASERTLCILLVLLSHNREFRYSRTLVRIANTCPSILDSPLRSTGTVA